MYVPPTALILNTSAVKIHNASCIIITCSHQIEIASIQAQEEPKSAIEAAAENLDTSEGPGSFTDFLKVVLHPRSVVQVPLLGSSITGGPTGFGGITSHADIAKQVCCSSHSLSVLHAWCT